MTKLQITYFLAVVEHGSFTRAANELFISQPTLTQQISSLEKELGFKLLVRLHNSLRLTEEGRIMLPVFREFDNSFRDAHNRASQISQGQSGCLTVGLLIMSDVMDIPHRINEFCAKDANRSVKYYHGAFVELGTTLQKGDLDFIFIFDDLATAFPEFPSVPVFKSEYKLVMASNDPLAQKKDIRPSDFKGKTLLDTLFEYPSVQEMNRRVFDELGFSSYSIQYCASLETAYTLVASGVGFALCDEHNTLLGKERFSFVDTGLFHNMCVVWNRMCLSSLARRCLQEVFHVPSDLF